MKDQENKITKILVAVDLSAYSRPILEYAVEVANMTDARIFIINVINQKEIDSVKKAVNLKYSDNFSLAIYLSEELGPRELVLKTLIKETPGLSELKPVTLVKHGVPYAQILKTIDREQMDFLIFGPKGQTNLKEFLFGSVAEKLFRHSPVPVMSLRPLEV